MRCQKVKRTRYSTEAEVKDLHAKIGLLTVDVIFCSKPSENGKHIPEETYDE